MKKYLILALLIFALIITACTRGNEGESETPDTVETPIETEAPTEAPSEAPKIEPIEYIYHEISGEPVYDKENDLLKISLSDYVILIFPDVECTVGVLSDDGMSAITARTAYDECPELKVDTDIYSGVALKLDEKIDAGTYKLFVVFGTHRVDFEITVD